MYKNIMLWMAIIFSGTLHASEGGAAQLQNGLYSTSSESCWVHVIGDNDDIFLEWTDPMDYSGRWCRRHGIVEVGTRRVLERKDENKDDGLADQKHVFDVFQKAVVIDLSYMRRCSRFPHSDACQGVIDPDTRKLLPGVKRGDWVFHYLSLSILTENAFLAERTYRVMSAESESRPPVFRNRPYRNSVLFRIY